MRHLTADQLIAKLQVPQHAGVPGDIAVAVPALDNSARGAMVQRVEGLAGLR